jgi:hypothetical protein
MHRYLVATALLLIPGMAQTPAKFTAPKTPWGDPDLQGWFTNLSEDGTPLERPDQFAGRKLEDIKGDELAAIKRDVQKRTVENFQGPLHAPEHWWQDDLNLVKGSQAWLVVDPPDGKVPAMTPEAEKRSCTCAWEPGSVIRARRATMRRAPTAGERFVETE